VLGTLNTNALYRYVVIAAAEDIDGYRHLKKLKIILIFVCIISLIAFSIAGWLFSGRALKPISDVVKRVRDISITSMNLRVPEGNGTDEIGKLARTFNDMLQRLEGSFAIQKNFIANASHELRTPLTSINGQIEVLMMKERSGEEYKSALNSVLDDIQSLIDLTNKLLLIARTSPGTSQVFTDSVRIDEILWQIQEEMKRRRNECIVNITIDDSLTDSDQMIVRGDESLLRTAFSNIIDNACKFSGDHSVEISLRYSEGNIDVFFEDHGIGIEEEDLKKIFEPFYRAGNAISVPGHGIGLQIVSQIIRNHNGSVFITSQKGKGTIVKVILPVEH
jgi:signal transduction histidine kinase